jgi:hypothetical protein
MAIVLAAMALLILSIIGAGLVLTTSTEALISGAFRAGTEARYAARAAADRALVDLVMLSSWDPALAGTAYSSFNDGLPIGPRALAAGGALDLTHVVNLANCGETSGCSTAAMNAVRADRPWGANNPRWQLYAWGWAGALEGVPRTNGDYYVVALVGDDGAENDGNPMRDGTSPGNPGSGRLLVRGMAFGARGARASVEFALIRMSGGGVKVLTVKDL